MKIKRFFAPDMRQAIRLVREEHGPDAVILSTRRAEGGIEIISAIDFDQDAVHAMAGSAPARHEPYEFSFDDEDDVPAAPTSTYDLLKERAAAAAPAVRETAMRETPVREAVAPQKEVVWSQDPAIVAMRQEIESMRGLLQEQLSQLAWGDYTRKNPLQAHLVRRLTRLGLSSKLAREIADKFSRLKDPQQAWPLALERLAQMLPVVDDPVEHGGVIALVGPTGVGKTTTIAKLAARFVQRHGRSQVALISTDSYRIGAQKQLMTFGQILGVETFSVSSQEELDKVLRSLLDKKLILIDTAGMSQRDVRLAQQFSSLTSNPLIRTYLVMSANTERAVMEEVVAAYGRVRVDGCIITKVDEAVSLGSALSVAIGGRLPIAYVSDGQRVPEDLHPARSSRLVGRAVNLMQSHRKAEALREERSGAASPINTKRTGPNAHV